MSLEVGLYVNFQCVRKGKVGIFWRNIIKNKVFSKSRNSLCKVSKRKKTLLLLNKH